MNGLLMQYFEWHTPNDGQHWRRLEADAQHLAELGVTAVWLPPCYKGSGQNDVGYGVYDLYDLGEFDQKGTVRTKYGTKVELLAAIKALQSNGIQVYADLVLNHRGGADHTERFTVIEVDPQSRQKAISKPYEIEGWTHFSFDVRLHQNLHQASLAGRHYDLRKIFDGTLVAANPTMAVTFVDNHDSQPGEALESFVEAWFKPLAYALILLREAGFPCLFYGDYYGIEGQNGHAPLLDKLLKLRQQHAYGKQDDYFDNPTCLAWVRSGNDHHPNGCAVLINTAEASHKRLFIGQDKAGQVWRDSLGHCPEDITIGQDGWADFPVPAGSLAVWVKEETEAYGDD